MAYSGQIRNQSFEAWTNATTPEDIQSRVANTTISRLQRDQQYDVTHPGVETIRRVMDIDRSGIAPGPLVYDGLSALRATIDANETADDFRIWGPGALLVVALTGAAGQPLAISPGERMHFSVMARCNVPGNLLRLRIFFRDVGDNVLGAVDTNGFVQASAQNVPLPMSDSWRRLAIHWIQPAAIGGVNIEHAVWQLSSGTAGAQVIDLDDMHYGGQFESEEG